MVPALTRCQILGEQITSSKFLTTYKTGEFELDCLKVGPDQLYMILEKEISRILEEECQQTFGSPGAPL